jgi:hypothetical protein
MISINRPPVRLLLVAAVLAAAGTERLARAQDDDEPAANALANRERELGELRAALIQKQHEHQLEVQRDRHKARFERLLSSRLDELKESCQLTEAQVQKLTVAGNGEIKRFMDRWDQIAGKTAGSRQDLNELHERLQKTNALTNEINTDFLGEGSFFSKTLLRTLDQKQAASYEKARIESTRLAYERAVSRAFESMRNRLHLSNEQVEQLVQLLVRETRPPRRFGRAPGMALVLFQMSRLPEDTIKPILDEAQWRGLRRLITAYKNGAGAEEVLKRNGFIFDEGPADSRPVVPDAAMKPKTRTRLE